MIQIRCTNPERPTVFTLLVGRTYKVGRKNHDINFPDDQSISRDHATICVEHPMANMTDPLLTPTVVVTDLGSKFGTFANDGIERKSKMSMREALNLTPGDRFKFGLQWNEYKIEYTPLIVTPSALKDSVLKELKRAVMTLGGHLVQDWAPNCDYVIMDSVTLTVKVVCALLAAKHIVTPVFFQDMLQSFINKKASPDPNNFLPPVVERYLENHTWEPLPARSELFVGKTFVFCSTKHLKKMGIAVETGGGTCKLVTDVRNSDLLKENFILVKPSDRDLIVADSETRRALAHYTDNKKRLVSDSEIGVAALFLNIGKHCNPYEKFNKESEPLPKIPSQSQNNADKNTVIVPPTQPEEIETQLSYVPGDSSNRDVINETIIDQGQSSSSNKKRDVKVKNEPMSVPKKEETQDDEPPSKKRAAEEALTRLREKRLRPDAIPKTPQRSTRANTRGNTQRGGGGGLSAIFGVSDDEDDDDVMDMIPAIQPEAQIRKGGRAQESATMDPSADVVNVVPASPEMDMMSDQEEDLNITTAREETVFKSPERRSTRMHTRNSPQKQIPEPSTARASTSSQASSSSGAGGRSSRTTNKRKIVESSPETSPIKKEPESSQGVSKKQKMKQENETLVQKAEKLTIKPDVKDILTNGDGDDIPAPKAVEVLVSLIKAKPKIEPKIEVVNGKTIKNFKTFLKVLPLSMQQNNMSFASGASSSTRSGKGKGKGKGVISSSGSSIKSNKSIKITFVDYEHAPSLPGMFGNNRWGDNNRNTAVIEDVVQQNQRKRRATREEENDMEIEDIMPDTEAPIPESSPPESSSNTRSSRRTTRTIKPVDPPRTRPASPPAVEIERAPTRREKKKIQKVILSDDEDDEMFQF